MTTRFQYALRVVLGNEGGYVNDKADRGGATNFGVTQKTYDDFCKATGREKKPVAEITTEEVEMIYGGYWRDCHASYLPSNLDLLVFDCAINSGPKRAIKLLQRCLGVDEDGICGRQTLDAVHEEVVSGSIEELCDNYLLVRENFYHDIVENDPTQKRFIKGWIARLDHLREVVA